MIIALICMLSNQKNHCNKQLLKKSKISNLVIFLSNIRCLNYQNMRQKGEIALELLKPFQ